MAKPDDYASMSVKELTELQSKIGELIVERQKTERSELLTKMQKMAADSGLSLDEILGKTSGRRSSNGNGTRAPVAIKYRNPDNPAETWTGRGRNPRWMAQKLMKRGVKKEDFLV